MSRLTEKELKRYAIVSALVGIAGVVLLMIASIIHEESGFWTPYTAAFKGISQLIILISVLWFGMAMAHLHTSFFSVNETITVDKFILYLAAIGMLMAIIGYYAIANLPSTPPETLPRDENERESIVKRETRDKLYVAVLVLAFGGSFAAFPTMRCFGTTMFPEKKETAEEAS